MVNLSHLMCIQFVFVSAIVMGILFGVLLSANVTVIILRLMKQEELVLEFKKKLWPWISYLTLGA